METETSSFRQRLISRRGLIGTFIKTPSPPIAELLGNTELQVLCLDAEHAPFGRLDIDLCIAALRAADKPSLVRLPSDSPGEIRNALDSGANGIVVPHVTSAAQAARIVKAAHFGEGGRGYAGSTRAAEFTRKSMADHLKDSRAQTAVVVQIEDLAALDNVEQIAAVDGVDAVFVGRVDLAVAMRKSPSDPEVVQTIKDICLAARPSGTAIGMFTPVIGEIPMWREQGASFFLLSSEQSMILSGADALVETFRSHWGTGHSDDRSSD